MVKITDGKQVLTVTQNAYKEVFKRSGFTIYGVPQQDDTTIAKHETNATGAQPIKPISQWMRKELAEYLTNNGYTPEGKTEDLREFVKKHMQSAE